MNHLKIRELRLVMTGDCPYSCRYCNLYHKKLLESGRLSRHRFDKEYRIGNESFGLLADNSGPAFSLKDYEFLFLILSSRFGLEDITFTGGDPFLNPDIRKVIDSADKMGVRTTAITKGAPLFAIKSRRDAKKRLGNLSRIIFSLDTFDAKEHTKNNLPLLKTEIAIGFLPKTLRLIEALAGYGYNIEINSVIKPGSLASKKSLGRVMARIRQMVDFCLKNKIKKVKFLELDSKDTLGAPYIEDHFRVMIAAGLFAGLKFQPSRLPVDYKKGAVRIGRVAREASRSHDMHIMAYRTHCPTTFLNRRGRKKCEFSQGGELHLDFKGRSFLCQRDNHFKSIDIFDAVKSRNIKELASRLREIKEAVRDQKCKF